MTAIPAHRRPLSWLQIARLGLVQAALGAIVMLVTSLLNRVMVVEYAMAAAIPAGLVAFHYVVQLSRPYWGHGSDRGGQRTPWIVGGMGCLSLGALLATNAVLLSPGAPVLAAAAAILAYALIGAGVGASGTSLLALLASSVVPRRRPAAAALTWIMMIAGIIVSSASAGQMLDPFSPERLALVVGAVVLGAFLITLAATRGVEERAARVGAAEPAAAPAPERAPSLQSFRQALAEALASPATRLFTVFVFVSMVAYAMQDMILEPFAGLVFGYTPGESTRLASVQHSGVLLGMLLVGAGAAALGGGSLARMRLWVVGGCLGSAAALALLGLAALSEGSWPLGPTVFALGLANGVFAVSAIGAMMSLAGAGAPGREGIRMGLWGASQAMAFALGGFLGAAAADLGRATLAADAHAFGLVFAGEALLFVLAAGLAVRMDAALRPAPARSFTREIAA